MNIIGLMFNKNEGDILAEIITSAMNHVDILYFADDGSVDNSWDIATTALRYYNDRIVIQREPNKADPGQRQSLLDKIRSRHNPADSWVQIIESDIKILDTNVKEAIKGFAVNDIAVTWQLLNAVRAPSTWKEVDTYPVWDKNIREIMPLAHRIECMVYSFRPLPKLHYNPGIWRPWPSGFSHYSKTPVDIDRREPDSPLLAHYGFRGPKHFYKKYGKMGRWHKRYSTWNLTSIETIEATVPYFNGQWTKGAYSMGREGWVNWLEGKKRARNG